MKCIRSEIIGHGHYAPKKVLTNDDMAKIVETSDEWITTRTGIKSRCIVEDETTGDIALHAAEMAVKTAGIRPDEIDLMVLATITPDNTTPATSAKIAAKLGVKPGTPSFDMSAACSGFVYALTQADNMIRLGQAKTAVVIGAETLSKITDWTDRNTCVLFGDGAGAVVLRAVEGDGTAQDTGILASKLYSDGSHYDNLCTTGGPSSTQNPGFIAMEGKEVFKFAVNSMPEAALAAMELAGVGVNEIDWLIPHQANIRIIENVGKKLELPEEKVIVNIAKYGNTSAATIPMALSEKIGDGTIKKGDLVVLTAMGAGFTWASSVIRL